MGHFNHKSLTFYGVMIGSVLVLFKIVSVYGENSLKAPPNIAGNYLLENENLPDCLKSEKLSLAIAQSGIYLTGRLSTQNQRIKLNGLLDNASSNQVSRRSQPFSLVGKTEQLGDCPQSADNASSNIQLQTQFQNKRLVGQMQWSNLKLNFTGTHQNLPDKEESTH
ncbi:MAG: hypothetical protein VKL41_04640 [Snowella sp.]|nr:hypothetical protein [Snowella sp.]